MRGVVGGDVGGLLPAAVLVGLLLCVGRRCLWSGSSGGGAGRLRRRQVEAAGVRHAGRLRGEGRFRLGPGVLTGVGRWCDTRGRHGGCTRRGHLRGRLRLNGPRLSPTCTGSRGIRLTFRPHPWCGPERAGGREPRWEGPELVEHLDQFVVGAGLRQQLHGGGERLARARGRAEPRLRVRLQQRGHDLPQRLWDALGRTRRPMRREVLHERLGVRLGALQQIQRDQSYGEQVRGKSGSAPSICSGAR